MKCPSCGIPFENHLGVIGTCEKLQSVTKERDQAKRQRDELANFNPDWDLLTATQESLCEHMQMLATMTKERDEWKEICRNRDLTIKQSGDDWAKAMTERDAAQAEVVRLKNELELMTTARDLWKHDCDLLRSALADSIKSEHRFRAALHRYGQHINLCYSGMGQECNCGLDEARKAGGV